MFRKDAEETCPLQGTCYGLRDLPRGERGGARPPWVRIHVSSDDAQVARGAQEKMGLSPAHDVPKFQHAGTGARREVKDEKPAMDARDLSLPVCTSPSWMMVHYMWDGRRAPADHDPSTYLRFRHGGESRQIRWMGSKVGREATSLC